MSSVTDLRRTWSDLRRAHWQMTKGLNQSVSPGAQDHYRTMRSGIGLRIGEVEEEMARLAREGEGEDLSFLC